MARGWESKNVEEQQAERQRGDRAAGQTTTDADAARLSRRRTLELARARTAADLAAATHDAHRRSLQAALDTLDEQLQKESGSVLRNS
jgi:hypothetical protein